MELNFNGFQNFEEFFFLYHLLFKKYQKSQVFSTKDQEIYSVSMDNLFEQNLQSKDLLKFSINYYQDILRNRTIKKLPISITLTFSMLEYLVGDKQDYSRVGSIIVNCLNQIVDLNQKLKIKQSFLQTLLSLQFDQDIANIISEFRHSFTHKLFPSKNILEFVIVYLIKFLLNNFWKVTLKKNIHKLDFEKLTELIKNIELAYDQKTDLKFILDKVKNKNVSNQSLIQKQILSLMKCQDTLGIRKKIKKQKIKNAEEKILKFLLKQKKQDINKDKQELIQNYFIENTNISTFRNNFKKQKFKNLIYKILIKKDFNKNFEQFWDLFYQNFDRILRKDPFIQQYLDLKSKDCSELNVHQINTLYQNIVLNDTKFAYKKLFEDF